MAVNIVKLGKDVILDLTDATATPAVILTGFTAYGADGSKLQGTALGLNFTVVQSMSQPASPAENTLWVKVAKAEPWAVVEPRGLSVSSTGSLFAGIAIVGQLRQVGSTSSTSHCINLVRGSADSGVNLYVSDVQGTNNDAASHQYGWLPLDCKLYQNGAWQNISYAAEGYIYVTYPSGSYCQIESVDTGVTIESRDTSGQARFSIPYEGSWIVSCHNSGNTQTASQTIEAYYDDEASVTLSYSAIPEFTYTGDYDIVNDAGAAISTSQGNWNIRLLTSGKLTFQDLKNAAGGVDVFLVGGGAGGSAVGANGTGKSPYLNGSAGGGSGYTTTKTGVSIAAGTAYTASIGAGGAIHTDGGATSIVIGSATYSADGGKCSTYHAQGGAGGSGGGGGGYQTSGAGGTDGGNGGQGTTVYNTQAAAGGSGQGTTTRAFGDSSGVLYATGGGAGGGYNANTGASMSQGAGGGSTPNTGNGGKGGGNKEAGGAATAGGSGVIIIRNHRSA